MGSKSVPFVNFFIFFRRNVSKYILYEDYQKFIPNELEIINTWNL